MCRLYCSNFNSPSIDVEFAYRHRGLGLHDLLHDLASMRHHGENCRLAQ